MHCDVGNAAPEQAIHPATPMRLLLLAAAILAVSFLLAAAAEQAHAADYEWADFASQAEAEEYLLPGDPYRLDADSDGIAFESLR
jgi:hypothetical protein